MSAFTLRISTLDELRKTDDDAAEAAARQTRDEARRDLALQERVDRIRERLRAMIKVKKARGDTETGECCVRHLLRVLSHARPLSHQPQHRAGEHR